MLIRAAALLIALVCASAAICPAGAQQVGATAAPRSGPCPAPVPGPKPAVPGHPPADVGSALQARIEQAYQASPRAAQQDVSSLLGKDKALQTAFTALSGCTPPSPGPKPPLPNHPQAHPGEGVKDVLQTIKNDRARAAALTDLLISHPELNRALQRAQATKAEK